MAIFKMTVFILFYFFSRMAFAACEPYERGNSKEMICSDEKTQSMISEKCLKSDCDAKKFLSQYKASKSKNLKIIGIPNPALACGELQLPVVILKDAKNNEVSFCLFNDSSMLDATVVERLLL